MLIDIVQYVLPECTSQTNMTGEGGWVMVRCKNPQGPHPFCIQNSFQYNHERNVCCQNPKAVPFSLPHILFGLVKDGFKLVQGTDYCLYKCVVGGCVYTYNAFVQIHPGVHHCSLVITPLVAIIKEQTHKLQAAGIKACGVMKGMSDADLRGTSTK